MNLKGKFKISNNEINFSGKLDENSLANIFQQISFSIPPPPPLPLLEQTPPPPPPIPTPSPPTAEWKSNIKYFLGNVVQYKNKLYKCIYEHTSLENWAPEDTQSILWVEQNQQEPLPLPLPSSADKYVETPRFKIVSVGDIFKIEGAQFYETNNPSVFEVLPQNMGIKVLKVGQGCVRFKQQKGFLLDHIIGVFVNGYENCNRVLLGSISDNDVGMSIPFWLDFQNYCDLRYTVLSGGPDKFGWRLNYSTREYNIEEEGKKAKEFICHSQRLGMTPVFVYKNASMINLNSMEYMLQYYLDLEFLLDLINKESPNLSVWIIVEPELIKSLNKDVFIHTSPLQLLKTIGGLSKELVPKFESRLEGFIKSINWLIKFKCPQVRFGWQIGFVGSEPLPMETVPGNKTIVKVSDFIGHENGKNYIVKKARELGAFYMSLGVNLWSDFFVIDKGNVSFRGVNAESLSNVKESWWGWNSDHWYNYLVFCMTLKSVLKIDCVLSSIPSGHLNTSTTINKKTRKQFKELMNVPGEYEDSSVSFLFGDSFIPKTDLDFNYFVQNEYDSETVETDGHGTIIWKGIIKDLKDYGIIGILFGTDEKTDTHSGGLARKITDDNFLFSKIKDFLKF